MSGEQTTIVALVAVIIATAITVLAMFQGRPIVLKLPFGIEINFGNDGKPPANSKHVGVETREAIKAVIWQHNANFAAVLNGQDARILEQTTTQSGFAIARDNVERAQVAFRSYAIAGGELRDIKWVAFDAVNAQTIRVTADEVWEWLYSDNRRVQGVARNAYVTKRVDGNWRIDYSEIVSK